MRFMVFFTEDNNWSKTKTDQNLFWVRTSRETYKEYRKRENKTRMDYKKQQEKGDNLEELNKKEIIDRERTLDHD